ncbi:MAG: hypothetical protein AB7K71_39830 [Polyangiaceae bacterium]
MAKVSKEVREAVADDRKRSAVEQAADEGKYDSAAKPLIVFVLLFVLLLIYGYYA